MKFILNEKKYVSDLFKNQTMGKSEKISIRLLLKYYRTQHYSQEEAIQEVLNFMKTCISYFKVYEWEDLVRYYAKTVYQMENADLIEISKVIIYESEWQSILSVSDERHRRILYTLLVYKKVQNQMTHQENEWFYGNLSEIFKTAKITGKYATVSAQCTTIYQLKEAGFISLAKSIKSLNLKLNYFKPNREEEPVAFEVHNFSDILLEYYQQQQIRVVCCDICKKAVKLKKKERMTKKYCKSCQIIAQNNRVKKFHDSKKIQN